MTESGRAEVLFLRGASQESLAALESLGARLRLAESAAELAAARKLLISCESDPHELSLQLQSAGLLEALSQRLQRGAASLVLGRAFALLGARREGGPGLGFFRARAEEHKIEGFRRVGPGPGCSLIQSGEAFFDHESCFRQPPDQSCSWADDGGLFLAAIEHKGLLACQFFPEKSQNWGLSLLQRWLERGPAC
jgi:imidazoleglycerol phosphate synthase glutamine amidotransferase subunit HisH